MSKQARRIAPDWLPDRDVLELETELAGCDDPTERQTIRAQFHAMHAGIADRERQDEALAQLPDVWGTTHGEVTGLLALFSGLRRDGKLASPHTA